MLKNILFIIFLASCSSSLDNKKIFSADKPNFKILFTGNINSELEPCGCRQFPLGGINHVHGLISETKKNSHILFVDSGDTFFKQNFPINDEKNSQLFRAKNLSKALDMVGLDLKVIGDQDTAYGWEEFKNIINGRKYKILATNASKNLDINFQRHHIVNYGKHKIFFLGVSEPSLFSKGIQAFFQNPIKAIKNELNTIKTKGFNPENKFHHLIIISHAGIDYDKTLAEKFKEIKWILGSHSQSFTQRPYEAGEGFLAQVLSRNHYIGELSFEQKSPKIKYQFLEVNQQLAEKVPNNPVSSFLNKFQIDLNKILKLEQPSVMKVSSKETRLPTSTTCLDCHDAQGEFWQGTSHSLAYKTLVNNNAENDLSCLGCHSVGLGEKRGFSSPKDMVVIKDKFAGEDYWKKVFSKKSDNKPIRDWKKEEILEYSQHWYYTDLNHQVTHNYANVQCLNCHSHQEGHTEGVSYKKESYEDIKSRCLECHNSDQSDHWYGDKGKLNESAFMKAYNSVKCPENEE